MRCPLLRPGRRSLAALGVGFLAPLAWLVLVAVVPTDCARQKIADRLSLASGHKVTLGRLRVCPLGGVTLGDLTIGAPESGNSPWFQVREASIDVAPWQLLFGTVSPTRVDVQGLRLRILRRVDGRFELSDFLTLETDPRAASHVTSKAPECRGLEIRVRNSTVLVDDKPTGTHLELTGVEGRGTCQGPLAIIHELTGIISGGRIQLAAQVDRSGTAPRFEGQIRLRDVALAEGMGALAYLVPVASCGGSGGGLDGKLSLDLYLRGEGDSRATIRETLLGQGRLGLDPVTLDGSGLLAGLGDLFGLPPQNRIGDVWADLTIKDGRVGTENLTVGVAKVPVVLAGWTDFDGLINYRFRAEGLLEKLPAKAQDYLNQLKPGLKLHELADLKIQGTVAALSVTVRGIPVTRTDGGRRLNEIGRRVRDQIHR